MNYRSEFKEYEREAYWTFGRVLLFGVVAVVVLGAIGFGINLIFTPAAVISKVADPDAIINNYEEFQNMYNACKKLDGDLATIRAVKDDDQMFSQFSKSAMVAQKKQLLNRWVEEYNAKSKMITRSLWKAGALPYQLSVTEFPHYEEVR